MKNRSINTRFWSDGFIVSLDPIGRYLFLYFLTNERTEICGVYELPMAVIERETGLSTGEIGRCLELFHGRIDVIDGWVSLANFTKYHVFTADGQKGVDRGLAAVPAYILAKIAQKKGPTPLPPPSHYRPADVPFPNPNLNPNPSGGKRGGE